MDPDQDWHSVWAKLCEANQQRTKSSLARKMFRESSIQIRNNLDTKILNKVLSFRLDKFWVLKKPSHWDGSFEYPKHTLNKFLVLKKTISLRRFFWIPKAYVKQVLGAHKAISLSQFFWIPKTYVKQVFGAQKAISLRRFFWIPKTYVVREIKTSILSSYLEACNSLDRDTFHSFCSLFLFLFIYFFFFHFRFCTSSLSPGSLEFHENNNSNKNKKTLAFSSYKQVNIINID